MLRRIIFCGSRNWIDREVIHKEVERRGNNWIMIQGGARGADKIAKEEAEASGIPTITVHANWRHYGKKAGPIRNGWMLDLFPIYEVVAFPLPNSVGTYDMIRRAKENGVPVKDVSKEI